MKTNVPEKIYMTPSFEEPDNVLLALFNKSHLNFHRDIEYTRTDAFIEKACRWIREIWNDNYTMPIIIDDSVIEDFKNYMKRE